MVKRYVLSWTALRAAFSYQRRDCRLALGAVLPGGLRGGAPGAPPVADAEVARDADHLQLFVENYCSALDAHLAGLPGLATRG